MMGEPPDITLGISDQTLNSVINLPQGVACDIRIARKSYLKMIKAQCTVDLLKTLQDRKVGTSEIEGFLRRTFYRDAGAWESRKSRANYLKLGKAIYPDVGA